MKTACLLSALALGSAAAPPRISVALEGQVVANTALQSSVGKECEAGTATPTNCPYPVASAFDHHDKEVTVQQQVWTLVNGGEPTLACDTEKGEACDASIVDYSKPGEYLFLYNAEDAAGNKAVSGGDASMASGDKQYPDASVTFNLVLVDHNAPTICYDHAVAGTDRASCQDGGFKSDADKIFTVQGGIGNTAFELKKSVVSDDQTASNEMLVSYSVNFCPDGTTAETAIQTGHCAIDTFSTKASTLDVPATVQDQINKYVTGSERQTGFVSITMDAHDEAGIYGENNQNNAAAPLLVAVKIIDTEAPSIQVEGPITQTLECGSSDTTQYVDDGAKFTETLDRCVAPPCTDGAPRDAGGNLVSLTGSCVAGDEGFCHFTDNIASKSATCAPQYPGKTCSAGQVSGSFDVIYTATDSDNNQKRATRKITISDSTVPVITLKKAATDGTVYVCDKEQAGECDVQFSTLQSHSSSAIDQFDPGFTVSDDCDEHINGDQVTQSWGNKPFDRRTIGEYVRTYHAKDASGNVGVAYRTFHVIDEEKPIITMAGTGLQTLEASNTDQYIDAGASCDDFVDGMLNRRVVVSGDVVLPSTVGTYNIKYDCEDLSENSAVPITRTVVVEDTTAPTISLTGLDTVSVEAGFPYADAGATASDSLDGALEPCSSTSGDNCIRKFGDSVNSFYEYHSRMSCRDIYASAKVGGRTATSGPYTITSDKQGELNLVNVLCDMESADVQNTYLLVDSPSVDAAARQQTCAAEYGMNALAPEDVTAGVTAFFTGTPHGSVYLPTTGAQTGYYCTTLDSEATSESLADLDCTESSNDHRCTRSGSYTIMYTAKDNADNAAVAVSRNVVVVDSLPPVISLRFHAKQELADATRLQSDEPSFPRADRLIQTSAGGSSTAQSNLGSANPAADAAHNPYLNGLMAETATSTNGWLLAAAASAVTGVAFLAASSKKTSTSVPV